MYIINLYFAQASENIMEIIEQYSDLTAINVNGSIYIYSKKLFGNCSHCCFCQISNTILCSLKATTTQIYWQELLRQKIYYSAVTCRPQMFTVMLLLCYMCPLHRRSRYIDADDRRYRKALALEG